MEKHYTFDVSGHVFRRIFSYTENGIYHTMRLPGGAALVQQILSRSGLAEYKALDDTFRSEHLELQQFEDRQSKKTYYAIARRIGMTAGKEISPQPADAAYAIIWDEGYGGLTPPAGTPILWASNKVLPAEEAFNTVAEHCFLMLDANTLRNNGAMISRQISWERTVTELIRQIKNNPRLLYLTKASHLLITFAEDGAVYMKQGAHHPVLVLTHGGGENILREKIKGQIDDTFAVMVASAALQFRTLIEGEEAFRIRPVLKAAENLMETGYSIDRLCQGNFYIPDGKTEMGQADTSFVIPDTLGGSVIEPDFWCISNKVDNKRIFDMACEYVLQGAKAIEGLPRLSFGALTTIDRWEIESYQNIRNLITGYASSDNVRPLSIAVFGAPGSGKSFGVTQIALNILPGRVEKLEFNVSQFTGKADLDAAFQKVRDVTLVGKLPLVFFDEFDSDRDGMPLAWIKSFLMPMQDGKFKDDSGEHPLGKCILVFAGGTSASFEAFIRPMQSDDPGFKNIKGPDFVSRLRGTINVLGPNRVNDTDNNYILRRALLLRSLSERKLKMKKGEAPINKNVLWAMLLVPEYRHGARSMEAILDMSRLESPMLEPASLPFYSQLSLHVDADAFIRLVLREVILNSFTEVLAKAIHEDYLKKMIAGGNENHPSALAWEALTEEFKESNRNQAQDMTTKLTQEGYAYDTGDTPFQSVEKFGDDALLRLAKNEHLRWTKEKLNNGWTFAPLEYGMGLAQKTSSPQEWRLLDKEKQKELAIKEMRKEKRTHLLVDWDELEEAEQEKDIQAVRNIIPLLKTVGLRVYQVF